MSYYNDKRYIEALENYTQINLLCRTLNQFDCNNSSYFEKRNYYATMMQSIKNEYLES